jgi:hypothetical protein
MTTEVSKACRFWESEEGERIRRKLTMIEDAFVEIRDDKDSTPRLNLL